MEISEIEAEQERKDAEKQMYAALDNVRDRESFLEFVRALALDREKPLKEKS